MRKSFGLRIVKFCRINPSETSHLSSMVASFPQIKIKAHGLLM